MPNWVYQGITIKGSKESIDKIYDLNMDFNRIIPMPSDLEIEDTSNPSADLQEKYDYNKKKYGATTWYDWRINNWGTKWVAKTLEDMEFRKRISDGEIVFVFWTAWALPDKIYEKLVKMFPDITIEVDCIEEGGYFFGTLFVDKKGFDCSSLRTDSQNVDYDKMFNEWFKTFGGKRNVK